MPKVLVTDNRFDSLDVEKAVLQPLGCAVVEAQCTTPEQVIAAARGFEYLITQFAPLTAAVLETLTECRVIARYGVGVDNIDLDAARANGIPVCNVPDYCMDEVADHALGLILALTRNVVAISNHVRQGFWKLPVALDQMHVLREMTVGVVGFGRIGREVVGRLKSFKCRLLVFDPVVSAADIERAGGVATSFDELLQASDLVTLHCPSTAQTRRLINHESLARMKRGALLVNVARGDLVVMEDLVNALGTGQLGGAALDVTVPEPINRDSPLLGMSNVIITNHVAAASPTAIRTLRTRVAEVIACAIRGEPLPNVVNGMAPMGRKLQP
jgi:D-3-phosphoglycerate dehydrogenase